MRFESASSTMKCIGEIIVSALPLGMIRYNDKGQAVLKAVFCSRKGKGSTHYLKVYDASTGRSIYVGNFNLVEEDEPKPQTPASKELDDKLKELIGDGEIEEADNAFWWDEM